MPFFTKRVTNLQREAPIIEVTIFPPAPIVNQYNDRKELIPHHRAIGLIDTGASISCIDVKIAEQMGLIARDFIPVLTPSGVSNHFTYDITIVFPPELESKVFFVEVTGADLSQQPFDILIGRDVLEQCTLIYNGWDNSFQLHT